MPKGDSGGGGARKESPEGEKVNVSEVVQQHIRYSYDCDIKVHTQ